MTRSLRARPLAIGLFLSLLGSACSARQPAGPLEASPGGAAGDESASTTPDALAEESSLVNPSVGDSSVAAPRIETTKPAAETHLDSPVTEVSSTLDAELKPASRAVDPQSAEVEPDEPAQGSESGLEAAIDSGAVTAPAESAEDDDQEARQDSSEPRLGSGGAELQGQGTSGGTTTADVLAQADPAAVDSWRRMLAASRAQKTAGGDSGATLPPPQSFHLEANVITRDGANTNQLEVEYRFLSPHFVSFLLPSNRQTGRGPGTGLSAYWLKDGDEVQRLETRDNKEDRRLVNEMVALARNFLALTDPERIRLTRLERLEGPPVALPKSVKKEIARELRRAAEANDLTDSTVTWIRLTSPDFDLVRRGDSAPDARRDELVSLAIGPMGLPLAAVVQDPAELGQPLSGNASLISLGSWVLKNDFRVPYRIQVFRTEPLETAGGAIAWRFAEDPVQDIALSKADLRPNFVPTDFNPQ